MPIVNAGACLRFLPALLVGQMRLLTLREAARFLHDTVTVRSLRRAGRRDGKLKIIEIGRKHFTTEAALADMLTASTLTPRRQCPDRAKIPDSTSENVRDGEQFGSFSPQRVKSAQAAALMSAQRLRKRANNTSPNTTERREASIVPIGSSLPKS